jgi:hypothetical protein
MNFIEVVKLDGFGDFIFQENFHSSVQGIGPRTQFGHKILCRRFGIGLSKTWEHLLLLLKAHEGFMIFL